MKKGPKGFYNIVNSGTESKIGEIRIYGNIPDIDWDEYKLKNTVDQFIKDFKQLEDTCDRIDIHINSGGGSLYHGFAMFNVIASSKKDIHTYNDGIAYSLGAILLVAGKTVHAAKNSIMMIHNGLTTYAAGNAKALREMADTLDLYDAQIAGMFADKTGQNVDDVMATYMNYKDTYFTATKAHEAKLVDIIEDYAADVPENIQNMSESDIRNYFNNSDTEGKESFFNRMVEKVRASVGNLIPTNTITLEEEPMKFTNLEEALNKADEKNGLTLSPADVANLKNEVAAFNGANEKFTKAELDLAVENAKKELSTQVDNLTTERDTFKAEAEKLGKLDGANRKEAGANNSEKNNGHTTDEKDAYNSKNFSWNQRAANL